MIDPNELLGQDLGGYRVTAFLGAGASAWVYRGVSTFDANIIRALKVVHPSLTQEAEFRQRFAEEAHTLDRLRHPGIVRFYGVRPIQFRGEELLVMELEFLDGHTLRQYATRADPTAIPLHRAVRWVREAAEAIGVAHQMGVVHRDLKPDNLQLISNGQVKVLDFGLARAVDDTARVRSITLAGVVPGTPAYMAPELCRGQLPTGASDVYGLGIILFELLTGRHPFAEPDGSLPEATHMALAQLDRPVPPVTSLRSDVPPALASVLASVLAKRPSDRPSDAAQLAGALRGVEPMLTTHASTNLRVIDLAGSQPPPVVPSYAPPAQASGGYGTQQPAGPSYPAQGYPGPHPSSQPGGYTGFQMPSIPTSALRPMSQYGQPTQGSNYGWIFVGGAIGMAMILAFLVSPWGPWEIDLGGLTRAPAHTPPAQTQTTRPAAAPACVPRCSAGACNVSDGCGGACTCNPGQTCVNSVCRCAPHCAAVAHPCGPDSCSGECGQCRSGWQCASGSCGLNETGRWTLKVVRADILTRDGTNPYLRVSGSGQESPRLTGQRNPRWDWTAGTFYPSMFQGNGVSIELWNDNIMPFDYTHLCTATVHLNDEAFWDFHREIPVTCGSSATLYMLIEPVR